jgi:hypothetical protein
MIRNLDLYLQERGLVKELSLAHLRETRLGIEAGAYIDHLLNAPDTKESLVPALGGTPLALGARIEENLRSFEGHRIKPVFVFAGFDPARKDKAFSLHSDEQNTRTVRRQQAWDNFEKGKTDLATMGFAASASTSTKDILRLIHRLFKHRRVEFMTAPYLAAAQVRTYLAAPYYALNIFPAGLYGATPQAVYSCHLWLYRNIAL